VDNWRCLSGGFVRVMGGALRGESFATAIPGKFAGNARKRSNIGYRWELVPNERHILAMENDRDDTADSNRCDDPTVCAHTLGSRNAKVPALPRRGSPPKALADNWIDELQWLKGFPGNWGEPRRGW
jgi:hypothetical protein